MATIEGQEISITQFIDNLTEEKTVRLSNGLLFSSKYDPCTNTTTNYLLGQDADVLALQELICSGNLTQQEMDRLEDLLACPDEIEAIRDRALAAMEMIALPAETSLDRVAVSR